MPDEIYVSLKTADGVSIANAINDLQNRFDSRSQALKENSEAVCFLRFFCSDVHTQALLIEKLWPREENTQRIYIGQTPLDSAYISLQAYFLQGAEKRATQDGSLLVRHGAYESLWTLDYPHCAGDAETQSTNVIQSLKDRLAAAGMTPAQNLLRTWFYVRDVDNNYAELIKARVSVYEACGLGPDEHFVASTGIEGCSPNPHALIGLHAHAAKGLAPEQITYLKALSHMSPTHDYGVNFERATRVVYGDRLHCHISGTASIGHKGNVLHIGDVARQFDRAVENIEALLDEGGMKLADLKCATIYLRDPWDYRIIKTMLEDRFPKDCAFNITNAPVCRPDWLVEIEGEAIAPCKSDYPNFL